MRQAREAGVGTCRRPTARWSGDHLLPDEVGALVDRVLQAAVEHAQLSPGNATSSRAPLVLTVHASRREHRASRAYLVWLPRQARLIGDARGRRRIAAMRGSDSSRAAHPRTRPTCSDRSPPGEFDASVARKRLQLLIADAAQPGREPELGCHARSNRTPLSVTRHRELAHRRVSPALDRQTKPHRLTTFAVPGQRQHVSADGGLRPGSGL